MAGMKKKAEVTIYDISKVLNISASTVSRGLNNNPQVRKELRKKIMHTAQEMGYQHNKFAANLQAEKNPYHRCGNTQDRQSLHVVSHLWNGKGGKQFGLPAADKPE